MPDSQTGAAPGAATSTRARVRPEVLAPAGDFDSIRAAVENGADAVYFGLTKHNARARAANFPVEELPGLMSFLRLRGVRGYVAFNTLVFADELADAAAYLERVIAAGPDALILQDPGVALLAREISPDIELHASTQTTTTCAEAMPALRELGYSRVILARELTLKDIRAIAQASPLPVEVFAHGALCIAYSGQCLTSEALGGRSANRGACAQACRLPYDLVVDKDVRDLGPRKYLLSPQDLAVYDLVPDLVEAGVRSFKIEGRLKTPEYVAATTRIYRKAVDEAWAERRATWSEEEILGLQQVFSRGLSKGFVAGIDHQVLVPALSPKKRGPFLGTVVSARHERVLLNLEGPLKPGDGISFDYGSPDDETGGPVYEIRIDGRRVSSASAGDFAELAFGAIDWTKVHAGDKVWKTSDPALERKLRASFEKETRKTPVDAVVSGAAGSPMTLVLGDGSARVSLASDAALETARTRPLTAEYLRDHLGRLGTTPFELRDLQVKLDGPVILPVSRINDLRRRAAAQLEQLRSNPGIPRVAPGALLRLRERAGEWMSERGDHDSRSHTPTPPRSHVVVLCRSLPQLAAVLDDGFREIELDFEDIKKYRDAVPLAKAKGATVLLAPPRIFKPGETGILNLVLSCAPDGVLVRGLPHLDFYRGKLPMTGDFSLNIANDLSAAWHLERGLERFTPSYDLNVAQLEALLERTPAGRTEIVIHQRMPMFHMEHCVFAATLSTGHDATDCGRPCDRHDVRLRDRMGMEHPLKADVGCRNTVFNAVPQSASPYLARFIAKGARRFRVELMNETPAEAAKLVRSYRDLLEGRADGDALWRELKASSVFGVTRGPLGRAE